MYVRIYVQICMEHILQLHVDGNVNGLYNLDIINKISNGNGYGVRNMYNIELTTCYIDMYIFVRAFVQYLPVPPKIVEI